MTEQMVTEYVRNAWYAAAWAEELTDQPLPRTLLGENVVLFRGASGVIGALEDICPHRMAPLSLGVVEGDNLRCGYHGLVFDCTGKCQEIPGQVNIPPKAHARHFPLVERWQLAWIWMGEPDRADPELIPNWFWLDHPDWDDSHGTIKYDCNYALIVDNLIDLSHTTFTHKGTIGTEDVAKTPILSERRNGAVYVERVMTQTEPSPFYKKAGGFTGKVDRWQKITYAPPGDMVIDAGAVPAGSNDPNQGIDTRIIGYLTPETDTTVFHFWAFARDFALGDDTVTSMIADQIEITFNEDKALLDGQQRNIDATPGRKLLDNNADAGVVLCRKLLDERLAADQADPA